ncbi:MAG: EI24 domain-containing protein [Elainella sp. Prado103]|nr:EI24 domain-containing protein [Elainella sp. Prado103]
MSQNSAFPKPPWWRNSTGLFIGAFYPFQALGLFIVLPQLRRYVVWPILLNVLIGITLYAGLLTAGWRAIDQLMWVLQDWVIGQTIRLASIDVAALVPTNAVALPFPVESASMHLPSVPGWGLAQAWFTELSWPDWLPDWPELTWTNFSLPPLPNWLNQIPALGLAVIGWLLRLILIILLLLITGLVLLQFGVLLGSPWYGRLSEELELLQTGQVQTIAINPVREIGRALLYELKKLVMTLGIGLSLLIANFFPGLGTAVGTIGGISLATTLVCLDFLDSALERRRLRFRQKLGVIWRTFPASASFGLVCLGLVSLPLLNLLAIPICVAAGTLFFCDRVAPNLKLPAPDSPKSAPSANPPDFR